MGSSKPPLDNYPFLAGGGTMGELIRNFKWERTPLKSPQHWPSELKVAVGIILRSPFPMHIAWGTDFIQFYNDAYCDIIWQTSRPIALGKPILSSFPEIWAQIEPVFSVVMKGEMRKIKNYQMRLEMNGVSAAHFFDLSLSPIVNEDGLVGGILTNIFETTQMVNTCAQLQSLQQELQNMQTKNLLQRESLINFLMQSPAGVCILGGHQYVFEMVNPLYQQLFPGRALLGKPVLEAIPELINDPIIDILDGVLQLGKTFKATDRLIPMARTTDGVIEERYFDLTYQARLDDNGLPNGILVYVIEVTERRKRELNTQKYLDIVSHEVKTPLTSLSAIVQLAGSHIQKSNSDDKFLMNAMEQADGHVKQMANMINIYLNLSQLKTGLISINAHLFDLNLVISQVVDHLRHRSSRHQFIFESSVTCMVNADQEKITLVLNNLIGSAIKYSAAGGKITINCEVVNGFTEVAVSDDGLGIRAHDLERIFIYLNEEIIEGHGGKIWTQNEPLKGFTFHFSLPLHELAN